MLYVLKHMYSLSLQTLEDVHEHVTNEVHHLMVVEVEGHFKVKANKLCQVTMRVGVFCSEHCTQSFCMNYANHSSPETWCNICKKKKKKKRQKVTQTMGMHASATSM